MPDKSPGAEGVGTVNLPETALNFWPDVGEVMTAPAQLELYCTLV